MLLKDLLDSSLEEVAVLLGSTVASVKAAMKRAISKLASIPQIQRRVQPATPELSGQLHLYLSDSIGTTGMTFENSFTSVLPVSSPGESRDSA